ALGIFESVHGRHPLPAGRPNRAKIFVFKGSIGPYSGAPHSVSADVFGSAHIGNGGNSDNRLLARWAVVRHRGCGSNSVRILQGRHSLLCSRWTDARDRLLPQISRERTAIRAAPTAAYRSETSKPARPAESAFPFQYAEHDFCAHV